MSTVSMDLLFCRVDFVDSLGRSRRCLKKDLPDLQRQDEELKERKRCIFMFLFCDIGSQYTLP